MKLSAGDAAKIVGMLNLRRGLVTAVTIDAATKDVLMVAMMNREAALKTLTTGLMHYWSRSRRKLWMKGEKSGHVQRVKRVRVDCDVDALLFDVEQVGVACHTGHRSCFHREVRKGKLVKVMKREFDPREVYQ
jgi:phosphoribosyl-AMP cyclohydrolase